MTDKERKKRESGGPADYGDATPEQVATALLKHRPKYKQRDPHN